MQTRRPKLVETPSSGLRQRGFTASTTDNDNCLYIRNDCILILYMDDCLIFAKSDQIIDNLIEDL